MEAETTIIGLCVGAALSLYPGIKLGKYYLVKGLYNAGKIDETPTILNSARLFKRYIKSLKDEAVRPPADPNMN